MTAHMGHQRGDAGAPGDRGRLAGRGPDVAEAVQLLPRGPPRGGVQAGGSEGGVYLVIGSRGVGMALKEGRHGCGGSRQPAGLQFVQAILAVLRDSRRHRSSHGVNVAIGQRRRAGGQPLLPKRFALKLDEVGVTLAFLDDLAQPVLGELDVVPAQRLLQRLPGGRVARADPRRAARSPGGSRRSRPSSRAARATPACPPTPAGKAHRSAPAGLR